jgi:amino acid permease
MLGINKGTTTAVMVGEAPNPLRHLREGIGATIWVVLFIITMITISIALYVRQ